LIIRNFLLYNDEVPSGQGDPSESAGEGGKFPIGGKVLQSTMWWTQDKPTIPPIRRE